jgi:RHS repeat-associated protein
MSDEVRGGKSVSNHQAINSVKDFVSKSYGGAARKATSSYEAVIENRRFLQQYFDTEHEYIHDWRRAYEPGYGQRLQSDLTGFGREGNVYRYVSGTTVGQVAPTSDLGISETLWRGGAGIALQLLADGGDQMGVNLKDVAFAIASGALGETLRIASEISH